MPRKLISGTLITEDALKRDYAILFDRKIERIAPLADFDLADYPDVEVLKHDGFISPGFIDMHIHGSGGFDAMDGDQESLNTIRQTIVRSGTTGFLPTTMTMAEDKIIAALDNIRSVMTDQDGTPGARILGIHLEGPFINAEYKGAQDPQYVQVPNNRWLKPYYDIIKVITMAPEMDEDLKMTKEWVDAGILISIGHSSCTYDEAKEAYQAGVSHVTHCFNAMSKLHHREPGVVGAALLLPFTVDMIVDGHHLRPEIVDAITRWKKPEEICLITDGIRATYLGDGLSELGGQRVTIKDGKCLLDDGTIAGSILRLDDAVKNTLTYTKKGLVDVINMASINVAREIGVDDTKGSLVEGKDADIVLFSNAFEIQDVFIEGVSQHDLL